MALGLGDSNKLKYRRKNLPTNGAASNADMSSNASLATSQSTLSQNGNKRSLQDEDYIFPLDEDQMQIETPTPTSNVPQFNAHSIKLRKTSPSRTTSKANAAVMRTKYVSVVRLNIRFV